MPAKRTSKKKKPVAWRSDHARLAGHGRRSRQRVLAGVGLRPNVGEMLLLQPLELLFRNRLAMPTRKPMKYLSIPFGMLGLA